jgi:2-methylcitrate dehydratase PrpD
VAEAGTITATLIEHAFAIAARPLPSDVVEAGRHTLLDWHATAISGAYEPVVALLIAEAREQGGDPVARIVLHDDRMSASHAALINATAADALDFSDLNVAMHGHSGPAVVATALALGERTNASGADVLTAIVIGVELECRVGVLIADALLARGFHPTASIATFGATAAAAYLLGLTEDEWAHAFGLAATQAAGLLASGGTMSKPFHSGKAAMNGMLAASLAKRGWIARDDALEAAGGFFATHAGTADVRDLAAVRERFFILDTIVKVHAACALTHSTIENMRDAQAAHAVTAATIAEIQLHVPPYFLDVCNIHEATTALEAKFSLRTVAAMTLLGDDMGTPRTYEIENITRPELTTLRDRIAVVPDAALRGGRATARVHLTAGRRLDVASDCFTKPYGLDVQRERVIAKFHALTRPIIPEQAARTLLDQILAIEQLASIRDLSRPTTIGCVA